MSGYGDIYHAERQREWDALPKKEKQRIQNEELLKYYMKNKPEVFVWLVDNFDAIKQLIETNENKTGNEK